MGIERELVGRWLFEPVDPEGVRNSQLVPYTDAVRGALPGGRASVTGYGMSHPEADRAARQKAHELECSPPLPFPAGVGPIGPYV